MAIKPETILGLCRRPISGPEKLLLAKVELDIDEFLKLNFEPDICPYFILTEQLSLASMHELLRRYRSAGWKVAAWPNGRSTSTVLYFVQRKRSGLEQPQQLNGEH